MADVRAAFRMPLLALGLASLVAGVLAGLLRIGWDVPWPSPTGAAMHGALMVPAFFGTVIALERAVAIGQRWAYIGPLAAGLGGAALIAGAPESAAKALLVVGSVGLVAASIVVVARQRALFTLTIAAGAVCLLAGNALWLGGATIQAALPWWLAFLVLTIAGERLELSRLLRPSRASVRLFALLISILVAGVAGLGVRVFAAGLGGIALWLVWHDVAWRTVRQQGLPRFIAICLLMGYAWLATSAAISFVAGGLFPGTLGYDAALHALLIGFVMSMVLGHAPVIVPAVARVQVPYHRTFYVPLALLHVSLAVRVAGDAATRYDWRAVGGALNAVAILSFVVSTLTAVARSKRRAGSEGPGKISPVWPVVGAVGVLFGLVTIVEGGAVIFVDGEARRAAGNYVPFVLYLNFSAGFAYVAAGLGIALRKPWGKRLAIAIAAITGLGFVAFGVHVMEGRAYEARTVIAMTVRTLFWSLVGLGASSGLRGRPVAEPTTS